MNNISLGAGRGFVLCGGQYMRVIATDIHTHRIPEIDADFARAVGANHTRVASAERISLARGTESTLNLQRRAQTKHAAPAEVSLDLLSSC